MGVIAIACNRRDLGVNIIMFEKRGLGVSATVMNVSMLKKLLAVM